MKKLFFSLLLLPLFSEAQIIKTVAGSGTAGYSGDGMPATSAQLHSPASTVSDPAGNLYICEFDNSVVRKISTSGIASTIAGTGSIGYSGDGGQATAAAIKNPVGIARDAAGNIYICDYGNHAIRKINATTNVITTIAGTGVSGYNGDGIAATSAQLSFPLCMALDAAGNIYFADGNNQRVRKINTSGMISTIAGTGSSGFSGDGGAATSAAVSNPFGVAVDEAGNVYFSDQSNNRIRKIVPAGTISTIAGTGAVGYSGDGGVATAAKMNTPIEITLDTGGHLLVADRHNNCVRRIKLSTGIITTLAGTGAAGFGGDGGPATAAQLNEVGGLSADGTGIVYISDFGNNRVRKIVAAPTTVAGVIEKAGNFMFYPNPAENNLTISASADRIQVVHITNMLGQSMIRLQDVDKEVIAVDLSNLLPGVYMLHVNNSIARSFVKR